MQIRSRLALAGALLAMAAFAPPAGAAPSSAAGDTRTSGASRERPATGVQVAQFRRGGGARVRGSGRVFRGGGRVFRGRGVARPRAVAPRARGGRVFRGPRTRFVPRSRIVRPRVVRPRVVRPGRRIYRRPARRFRTRRPGFTYFYGGWWYPYAWWLGAPPVTVYEYETAPPPAAGRCAYWARRCAARWGRSGPNFRGCMRYHRC